MVTPNCVAIANRTGPLQNQEVTSHKHLGLYISNDCSWHDYITYINDKAWDRINGYAKTKI